MDAALARSAPEPGQAKLGPIKEERVDAVQGCYNQPHVARPLRLEEKREVAQIRDHVGPEGGNKASYARRWHWDRGGGRIPRQQTLQG
ncbi:hypothetical protein NDU88_010722 [Pleurodeles waltl]|uniref:Uncharacterized protein n=1 Tax=Pleurodeles waltl TaxID=8319 RepID=A0AAV7RZT7_PLEWA|nr:hypothetical protein NDU88_010722 [Pleurodeles waltl]